MNGALSPGKPVLLVPCVEPGRGGGHLARCFSLALTLRRLDREVFLYLETEAPLAALESLVGDAYNRESCRTISSRKEAAKVSWELIVLDRFQTPPEEYAFWSSLGPLLGIDEGGFLRGDFDFLLDILPGLPKFSPPNLTEPSLLSLPLMRHSGPVPDPDPSVRLRVLISFGAEDKARLGPLSAAALKPLEKELDITLLDPSEGKCIPELREHLADYDLLITHFGLTAFEAVYAGLAVLLLSPGEYHEKLGRAAGFFSAGIGQSGLCLLHRLFIFRGTLNRDFVRGLKQRCVNIAKRYGLDKVPAHSLGSFVEKLRPRGNFRRDRPCPACGAVWSLGDIPPWDEAAQDGSAGSDHQVLARFPDRTYRRCPRCGIVYMNRLNEPPIEYAREYFFEFYKKQYGKTYLEDFPHLVDMGKRRLKLISSFLSGQDRGTRPRLLDIGCAYGPFLKAASDAGFDPVGFEAAGEAVAYVSQELKFPVIQGLFPPESPDETDGSPLSQAGLSISLQNESFSALTLWYVIEHFREPKLALKEANRLLKPGGVLAFATPSFRGISGRKSAGVFLRNSPADHWTVWSPGICGALLKRGGFSLKKIVVIGHHPERFPLLGRLFKKKEGPLYRLFLSLSRLFGLGDSFEIYAVKD
ncbi:MAG: methyltransferase domain-containing protein [Treponema sp.]|jgi:SAM-dependent methyltransferase|nr:methyltransferase domain-containing protein [Treponema sp.]